MRSVDIFTAVGGRGQGDVGVLRATGVQTSRTLLNVLRCPGQPLPSRAFPVRPVSVVGIENPRPSGIWKAKSNRDALAFSSNFRLGQRREESILSGNTHRADISRASTAASVRSAGPAGLRICAKMKMRALTATFLGRAGARRRPCVCSHCPLGEEMRRAARRGFWFPAVGRALQAPSSL